MKSIFALFAQLSPVIALLLYLDGPLANAQTSVPGESGARIFARQFLSQAPPESIPPGTIDRDRRDLPPLPGDLPVPKPNEILESVPTPGQNLPTAPDLTVEVRRVEVLGNTVFSAEDLAPVVAPYEGRSLSFEELLSIRTAITDLYTRRGYMTSGAFLPPQEISDGVVRIQAVEGELERIEIAGLNRLKSSYVRDRLGIAAGPPVNIEQLEQALQLLQLDPRIRSVQADLKAGTTPGRSILTVDVREASALGSSLGIDNNDSPTVGSIRYSAALNHNNLLGFGDRLHLEYGRTEGVNDYNFRYEIPLNPRDGTLQLGYNNSRSTIVENPFDELDIKGRTQTVSLGFRQPIVRRSTEELALGLTLDWRQSRTFLLDDIPFSFSEGPEKGESKVTALRLSGDWVRRSPNRVLAARSQLSLGLDILGATSNDDAPDGRFISWIGQFQWVQGLGKNVVGVARVGTQLTPNSLLPLEQFSIGGVDTVRGYRQNQRVGDNGAIGSLEVRIPVFSGPEWLGVVEVAPFVDAGIVWNNSGSIPSPNTLVSTGLGLRWNGPHFSARVDWGLPLTDADDGGDSLQDSGLFFSLQVYPF
jgi:hemolysin activation/secretion protein